MRCIVMLAQLCALLMAWLLNSCVIDPLYQPHWDTGELSMLVIYGLHSVDAETNVPTEYSFAFVDGEGNPPDQHFVDREGMEVINKVRHADDSLAFEGYLPPSLYHLYSYAETKGFTINPIYANVETDNRGWAIKRPGHLFAGAWKKQIDFSHVYDDTLQVRQHTRDVVFRIAMSLGDSIELVSSDVRLSNVPQRMDMADGCLKPDYNTTMQLDLMPNRSTVPKRAMSQEHVIELEDTIRMLSPSPEEYASGMFGATLSVRLHFRHSKVGKYYSVQPVDCSFRNVLDAAYDEQYCILADDPYCIKRFVWQCPDTLRFRMVEKDSVMGDIVPWDIVTDFGSM